MERLAGKTVLVTGVSPNVIGGIAYGLADAGARLFCVDLRADYAAGCAAGIRSRGGDADAFACDVTDEPGVTRAVEAALARYGRIDALINGAAISRPFGLFDMSVEEFRLQVDVILTGAFLFTKHVAKAMIDGGVAGSIVNICSTEGHQGNAGNIAYGTAKAGILNFTRAAAMELAPARIRVNSLTPTATAPAEALVRAAEWNVPWTVSARAKRRPEHSAGGEGIPLGRMLLPSDCVPAAVFLASDDSLMVTGTDLRVDGGVIARYWRWNPANADA